MIIEKFAEKRGLPSLPEITEENWSTVRRQLMEIFFNEEYGTPIPEPSEISFHEEPITGARFCAGFAVQYEVKVHTVVCGKPFDFSFMACIPKADGPHPFFVLNNFHLGEPNEYLPIEEIIDRGFAVLHLNYKNITSDDGDFTTGLAACVYPDGAENRAGNAPGKIMMWAWANMRLMDYAMTLPCLDHENGAVIGHSRLGKTALVTGMLDERFRYIIANNSGCSGDALSRGNQGERLRDIIKTFPYWFCENYKQYTDKVKELPMDQHMLLATIAPRTVLTGAAYEDTWADPISQFLSCVAASPAWQQLGEDGLLCPDRLPEPNDNWDDGKLCFHYRYGVHFLSRLDWCAYMDTIDKKMGRK